MRSPRSRFEYACRVAAFAILGWLLGMSLIPSATRGIDRASTDEIPAHLSSWTKAPRTVALHADLTFVPDLWVVDWMAALSHSGHSMSWSGTPPAVAMSAEAMADPAGGVQVSIAAPSGSLVRLRDDVGIIDSIRVAGVGGRALLPDAVGTISAQAGAQNFNVAVPDSVPLRSIAVIGGAGWEGKFIVSALEERGWPVIARFSVAPNVDVMQGALTLDTSRVAAVVVVDTSVQSYGPAIDRFVRSGGGLVLAGPSANAHSLTDVAAGAVGARVRPAVEPTDTIGLGATGFYPVAVRRDGVVLEKRPSGVAMAARRVGAGRVMQVGYDDSWRWRMTGGPGAERAHREWWSRVIASVAYVPDAPLAHSSSASAPLARLVDRLGPARTITGPRVTHGGIDHRILLTLMMICLLAEWTSRRMRGYK